MRVWQVTRFAEPENMVLAEVEPPEPRPGQVRVRIKAAALNFFDLLLVQGKYQAKPAFPFTPGAEASGIVEAVGEGVTQTNVGDSVIALPVFGCFAEAVVCDQSRLLPLATGMDFAAAAAMPIVYQTSWFGLVDRAALQPGEWLLVHAGASGVGMAAIQIGRALGAQVIATASTPEKRAFCLEQGAHHALDYTETAWVDEVKRITGAGAAVIYDPVGGDIFDLSTKCIAPGGRILVIGFTSGRIPTIATNRLLLKNAAVVGAVWGNWCAQHPDYIPATHGRLMEYWRSGKLNPIVTRQYPLDQAPQALRDLSNRSAIGKSVLVM